MELLLPFVVELNLIVYTSSLPVSWSQSDWCWRAVLLHTCTVVHRSRHSSTWSGSQHRLVEFRPVNKDTSLKVKDIRTKDLPYVHTYSCKLNSTMLVMPST